MSKLIKRTKDNLFENIKSLLENARKHIIKTVNTSMIITYFHIGRMIVENEQKGEKRAMYAEKTIENLSKKLTKEFGKGFTSRNLRLFRKFYLIYGNNKIWKSLISKSDKIQLSWTHYVKLININDVNERNFYEIEAINQSWSVRELERQYNSSLYERLALSRNKKKINELSKKGQIIEKPKDVIKEPLILEKNNLPINI
jgi:predicted nuclease of restriction endonuclease-like (RecB) superfamily